MNKWDQRFLTMAAMVASWSKDPSTQTGAVIVRPDKTIASVGYNGFPRGCDDSQALHENRQEKYAKIIHCEMNAVLSARESLHGYTLYTFPFMSCDRCAAHMIQAGIKRTVANVCPDHLRDRWDDTLTRARNYYREAGISCEEII